MQCDLISLQNYAEMRPPLIAGAILYLNCMYTNGIHTIDILTLPDVKIVVLGALKRLIVR